MLSAAVVLAGALVVGCGGGGHAAGSGAGGRGGSTVLPRDGGGADAAGAAGADAGTDVGGTMIAICGNGIVEGSEACDGTAGCAPGEVCSSTCTCAPRVLPPPNTLSLIAAALAAGTIDYPTSLLLRAEALVGDERLPPEYDGDFSLAEDSLLYLEISGVWGSLTPAQQQALRPYVVRPTDPTSPYSQQAPIPDDPPDPMPSALACPPLAGNTTGADWRYTESKRNHFVIWSCGGGDPMADPFKAKRALVAQVADDLWDLETPGMGEPRGDDWAYGPEPVERIDVYLLRTNDCRYRSKKCWPLTGDALAAAVPDSPCDDSKGPLTSSGYLTLRLERIPDSGDLGKATSDFAHELFHLLSYGRNAEAQGFVCAGGKSLGRSKVSWLTEASATWAEWAYTPANDPDTRGKWYASYAARDPAVESLNETARAGDNPSYAAYGYPVFLAEDSGGAPSGFEGFWTSNGAARTPATLDDALDGAFSFGDHFRDFAVAAINKMLPGEAITSVLPTIDPAIPDNESPYFQPMVSLFPTQEDLPARTVLMPLAATYQTFEVPDEVRWVEIDLSGTEGSAHLAVDAVAEDAAGRWTRYRPDSPVFRFCRDDDGQDISQFHLVVSNFGHRDGDKVDGTYLVRARALCPSTITGSVHAVQTTFEHDELPGEVYNNNLRQVDDWTFSGPAPTSTTEALQAHWSGRFEHDDSTIKLACQPGGGKLSAIESSGSGSGTTPLVFTAIGPNTYGLFLAGVPTGSYPTSEIATGTDCDGISTSEESSGTVQDSYGTVQGYIKLTPEADKPDHFVGSAVVLHEENLTNGGQQTIDYKVSWNVSISRH